MRCVSAYVRRGQAAALDKQTAARRFNLSFKECVECVECVVLLVTHKVLWVI